MLVQIPKSPNMAVCHPEQPSHAKGLCRLCYDRAYSKANRGSLNANSRTFAIRHPESLKASRRKCKYGLTPEEFDRKFRLQGGLCAVCHTREATDVDHRHSDKQVRDLLCRTCNQALGLLRECIAIVRSAAEYLEKWEAHENDKNSDPEVS